MRSYESMRLMATPFLPNRPVRPENNKACVVSNRNQTPMTQIHTNAVQVSVEVCSAIQLDRKIVVDHLLTHGCMEARREDARTDHGYLRDVNASGQHICGDEDLCLAIPVLLQHCVAISIAQLTCQQRHLVPSINHACECVHVRFAGRLDARLNG